MDAVDWEDREAVRDYVWIFGYGSLIWKPGFPFEESAEGWLDGWTRFFWQGSTDHRGTVEQPGRVVTIMRQAGQRCYGRAYRITAEQAEQTFGYLDHREKGGYEQLWLPVQLLDGRRPECCLYRATCDNPNYLGPASAEEMAQQIRHSHGPSGANLAYFLRLCAALDEFAPPEPHLEELKSLLL